VLEPTTYLTRPLPLLVTLASGSVARRPTTVILAKGEEGVLEKERRRRREEEGKERIIDSMFIPGFGVYRLVYVLERVIGAWLVVDGFRKRGNGQWAGSFFLVLHVVRLKSCYGGTSLRREQI
jgi:hypothetical protein